MQKTYTIEMNNDGNPSSGSGWVKFFVKAESEFEAIQEAQRRHPDKKVSRIKLG